MKIDKVWVKRKIKTITEIVVLLLIIIAQIACATPTKGILQTEPPKDAKEFIRIVELRQNSIATLSAMSRIKAENKKGKRGIKALITIKGEDRLRLELLDILGQPFLTIVTNGSLADIYNANDRYLKRGLNTSDAFYEHTGIRISGKTINRIISQRLVSGNDKILSLKRDKLIGELHLNLEKDNLDTLEVSFDRNLHPMRIIRRDQKGNILEEVNYSDYKKVSDYIYFPKNISVAFPSHLLSLNMKLFDIEINKEVEEKMFQLEMPHP